MPWIAIADAEDIEEEDVLEVSVGDRVLAVYHAEDGFFVTDGICTHEHAHLAEGFVFGNIIECPKHQGRFDVRSGECKGSPVSVPVRTYPTRIVDGAIEANLGDD